MNMTSKKKKNNYVHVFFHPSSGNLTNSQQGFIRTTKHGCTFKGNERQLQGIYDLLRKTEYLRHEIKNINKQYIRLGRML